MGNNVSYVECETCSRLFKHNGTRGPKPRECPECRTSNRTAQSRIYRSRYTWTSYSKTSPKLETKKKKTWHCQICGKEIPSELPGYLFEAFPEEYIRLCSDCQNFVNSSKCFDLKKLIKEIK